MAAEAWKINVGVKLDTSKIQSDLNKALQSKSTTVKVRTDGSMSKLAGETNRLNQSTQDVINTYQVFSQILNKSVEAIKSMASATIELDSAITEFKKVSDLSGQSLDSYVNNLTKVGQSVARTGKPNRSEPVCCDGKAA